MVGAGAFRPLKQRVKSEGALAQALIDPLFVQILHGFSRAKDLT